MKNTITIERWEWPIFKAEPEPGCPNYIQISLSDPSCSVEVKATITVDKARVLGEHLISLSDALAKHRDTGLRDWLEKR